MRRCEEGALLAGRRAIPKQRVDPCPPPSSPPPSSCGAKDVDLFWPQRTTQPDISILEVQPVPACRVRVTVLNTTSTEGHRVKLDAVMVVDTPVGAVMQLMTKHT